jgi:hypothetical protein
VLAGGSMLWSWSLARRVPFVPLAPKLGTRYGLLLIALACFVLLRYSGAVLGSFEGAEIEPEFADERTFFWSILLLDLGVVVPCTIAGGVSLMRHTAVGHRALYAVVGWFALVPPSVASMALVMWVRDDPHASLPTVLLLSAVTVAFGILAWRTFVPLQRGAKAATHPERELK